MASTPGHCLARRSGAPYTTASVSADQGSLKAMPAGSAGSLGIAHDVCPDVSYTYCIYRPTVSPLLTPASSRNALLLQSLPTNTPFWQVNSRRRKDDTRVGTAARGIVERLSRLPYGQNIRTCLPTGGHASTIARASACLPLPSHPYSASIWTAMAEGGGDGLESPAGIYHGDSRSGTAAAQRVPGDRKSHPAQPDQRSCTLERWGAQGPGRNRKEVGQAGVGGGRQHRHTRHDPLLAP